MFKKIVKLFVSFSFGTYVIRIILLSYFFKRDVCNRVKEGGGCGCVGNSAFFRREECRGLVVLVFFKFEDIGVFIRDFKRDFDVGRFRFGFCERGRVVCLEEGLEGVMLRKREKNVFSFRRILCVLILDFYRFRNF